MAHQIDRLQKLSSRVAGQLTQFMTSDGEDSVPEEAGYRPDIQGNLQRKKRKETMGRVAIGAVGAAGLAGAAKYGPGLRKAAGDAVAKAGGQFGPTVGGVAKNVANKGLLKGAAALRNGASGLAGLRRKLHGFGSGAGPQEFGSAGQRRLQRVEKGIREFSSPMDEFNRTYGDQRKLAKDSLKEARGAFRDAKAGRGPVMEGARAKLRKESHAVRGAAVGALAGAGLGVVGGRALDRKIAKGVVKVVDRVARKKGRMVNITPGSVAKRAGGLAKPSLIGDAANAYGGASLGAAAGVQVGGRIRKKEKQSYARRDLDALVNLSARIGRLNTL
jgi:hypothetical protein